MSETRRLPTPRFAALLALAVCALCPPAARADGATQEPARPDAAAELTPVEASLARALRRARVQSELPTRHFVEELDELGAESIVAALELLELERVPVVEPGQPEQVLSRPQREILLAILARREPRAVVSAVDSRLTLAGDISGRLLALRVLGAVGDAGMLERLVFLTWARDEEEPPRVLEEALREAVARLLARDPSGFDKLAYVLRASPSALHGTLLQAAGDTRSKRMLEVGSALLVQRPDLASLVASQVSRVGRSPRPEVNRELVERLRWRLDVHDPSAVRAIVLALGELRDDDSIPSLIELLDGSDGGLAQNVAWALQRITGLPFPASSERWRDWYAQELAWFQHEERRVLRQLSSRDPAKVSEALREIGRRRTQREDLAVEVLEVLGRAEPSLRAQACDTLGLLGAELALPALVEQLDGDIPYCAQAAWRALGTISGLDLPAQGQAWRDALALDA